MPRINTFGPQPARDALRRERYTIAHAARLIDVPENHLRFVLSGKTAPSPEVRERLPKLLNLKLSQLFTSEALASKYDASKNVWKPVE